MILFISDLHLQASAPESAAAFMRFLDGPARQAEALWILGDLFEFWIGDDDLGDPFHAAIADALSQLSASGVRLKIMVGNRDFLLGQGFARASGGELVAEPAVLRQGNKTFVLVHGDAECTDDHAYQRYRRRIRSRFSVALLRSLPLSWRRRLAQRIRQGSEFRKQREPSAYGDLSPTAVSELLGRHDARYLIHGHTHRSARHCFTLPDTRMAERWVLPDWHERARWLELGPEGLTFREEQA
ncbi:UDP-2,3-diacylglucosamine diphosphatase [Uliginosibacterium paludis]|uniref:UDP-2,3-diacylglucosamine hydrolase n=1 Tax=Uliginosibacterium paludis TaxID=1615952 RepID=A0ABV2CKR0_9RHOO